MAITTTGGSGSYIKTSNTTPQTLLTTPSTTNALFLINIVETDSSGSFLTSRIEKVGPNTAVKICDKPLNAIVTYSYVGLVIS